MHYCQKNKKIYQTQLPPTYTAYAAYIEAAIAASGLVGVFVGVGVDMVVSIVGYYVLSAILRVDITIWYYQ